MLVKLKLSQAMARVIGVAPLALHHNNEGIGEKFVMAHDTTTWYNYMIVQMVLPAVCIGTS